MDRDITNFVSFGNNDNEFLPIKRCACGHISHLWDFKISIYRNSPTKCDVCGRKLYFSISIKVFEVEE